MTARLSRVLEKPEKSFSTSLLVFSLMRRPSRVKNPVWPAWHVKRGAEGGLGANRVRGRLKAKREGGVGEAESERTKGEEEAISVLPLCERHGSR